VFGATAFDPAFDSLADLDGADGFKLNGVGNESVGKAVSAAGDLNGDGFGDILIGSSDAETAYVMFGKEVGFTVAIELPG
jgi:hypothetical protein